MHHVYFEQELLDLRDEIAGHHPDLALILVSQPDTDIYIHLCEIGAHLGMLLSGDYTKKDILELCTIMTRKLIDKRTIYVKDIILPNSSEFDSSKGNNNG